MSDAADAVGQPFTTAEIEAWFRQSYPKIKSGTVNAHIRGMTANDPSRPHHPSLIPHRQLRLIRAIRIAGCG
jgi:endonuclease